MNPADIRKSYTLDALDEKLVAADPLTQFSKWWDEVLKAGIEEPNAMTLATADKQGRPEARTVLLKGFDTAGFVFYTNYESAKSKQLSEHPYCSLLFFWKELERQVRIAGSVEKVSAEETAEYFNSRPEGSRIGAWASPQSRVVEDKVWLENNYQIYEAKFKEGTIPVPAHWGGYRVIAERIEFWQGRPNRMHDRIQYRNESGQWIIERLAP
ncbi:MAG: pyridoxamine 5'-phosphate oxidase [Bacteroidetes bacterium]|nr:pyridoxamine 5'-phosphate oxidase [Bacteroidota bacterium]